MPKALPLKLRRDVVAVARKGEAPISRIATDFGISESCLQRWLKLADVEDGVKPGETQADITEHWTDEGKLHLCAIKDVHSNRIVGYSIDSRMTAELAVAALRNAVALRDPTGTTIHSHRESQFRSRNSSSCCAKPGSPGPWGGWAPAAITPRWSPSSHCCRKTF